MTEKLITRVINTEQRRMDQVAAESQVANTDFVPKCFLLIGEDDTNLGGIKTQEKYMTQNDKI